MLTDRKVAKIIVDEKLDKAIGIQMEKGPVIHAKNIISTT